jgi:hypothetical protein
VLNYVFAQYLESNKENFDPRYSNEHKQSGKFEISSTPSRYIVETPIAKERQPFSQLSVMKLR